MYIHLSVTNIISSSLTVILAMELAHYLMIASMKRSRQNSSSSSSWEEKAFAEDHLGGIVWPPRSYSCSFCHREFRSAQALGGHMNVHRRDRARLKNSSSNPNPNPNPKPSLFRVSAAQHHHKEDQLMITQKERSRSVFDDGMELKRVKVTDISSTMFPVKKCSTEEGGFVEEELDLELRLGSAAKLM